MADPGQQRLGIGDGELEVFGGDAIGELARLGEVAYPDERPARRKRGRDDPASRHRGDLALHRARYALEQGSVGREQDGLRDLVVLGLGKEVHRNPVGMGARVRDHQDLGRPRDHVDADVPEDAALGGGDVRVAGAHDLVHGGHGCGSVGERAHRLRTAHAKDAVDSRDRGGGEHRGVQHAPGRRGHHHQLRDARDLGRHRAHQYR